MMFIGKTELAGYVPKHIMALSWNIATEPKLYWELAPNPYTSHALQIISERFPGESSTDIIKAVVLAEPEGRYDINFKRLENEQQEEDLLKQRDIAVEINKRLVKFCKEHEKEFDLMPKEFIYESLTKVAFASDDVKEIEQRYAQNQRRDFKLLIVNFIENFEKTTVSQPVDESSFYMSSSPGGITTFKGGEDVVGNAQIHKSKLQQKYSALGQPVLKIFLTLLSVILLFYSANNLYKPNVEQRQMGVQEQILAVEDQNERQSFPVRLTIPAINVNAKIQHVGITSSGEMEVPSNTIDVGWFKLGPNPGDKGSAVIAGHVDGENGKDGVFTNLYKLKAGDKLFIEDNNGKTITFVVRESRTYAPGYAEEVFSLNDGAHLNLVTCDGVWDGVKKSYTKRLVVFTDIVY